jgi:hypothetical protein
MPDSHLYTEHTQNNNEHLRNEEPIMVRSILELAAEITSLATFGAMVAVWAIILGPLA